MTLQHFLCLVFVALTSVVVAQVDTLQLDDVHLSDTRLKRYAKNTTVKVLNDSVLQQHTGNTTEFLRFNTPIYFKENGYGMVSSPSFRGTSAAQTAVVWNGININSNFTGQTDFNTLSLNGFDAVTIKSGGGSSNFGTGAIGGSIHLENKLRFNTHLENRLQAGYGSFEHQRYGYQLNAGGSKWTINTHVNYQKSDNDYRYLETNERNENGDFNNFNINLSGGVFLSDTHLIKYYNQTFFGERNLSGTLVALSRSSYKDDTSRNLLKWTYLNSRFTAEASLAYLFERYKFFANKDKEDFSFGTAKTFLLRYNLDYRLNQKSRLFGLLEYQDIHGKGTAIRSAGNNTISALVNYKCAITDNFNFRATLRKVFNSEFKTPLVYGLDAQLELSNTYSLTLNATRDFRVPTFNDLYWQPGGNLDLVPERSHQLDFGQLFKYKQLVFKANVFVIDIKDMIQWVPDNSGIWSPTNRNYVQSKGLELDLGFTLKNLKINGNYSYTDSRDRTTNQQLIYVPFHKFSGTVAYNLKTVTAYYQQLINGEVYAIGRILDAYAVGNFGLSKSIKTKTIGTYKIGLIVNNVFNTYYENVALRPMPNRNFNFNLTYNF